MIDRVYKEVVSEEVIREKMESNLSISKKQILIYSELLKNLEKFEGKKVTKRIQTHLESIEFFKEYDVVFRKKYSWFEIGITPKNNKNVISFGSSFNVMLFYETDSYFLNVERIKKLNPSLEIGVSDSIKNIEKNLKNLSATVKKYNELVKEVKCFEKENEDIMWFFREDCK